MRDRHTVSGVGPHEARRARPQSDTDLFAMCPTHLCAHFCAPTGVLGVRDLWGMFSNKNADGSREPKGEGDATLSDKNADGSREAEGGAL